MELQADCFVGVWGKLAEKQQMLEAGDLQAIGDDRLQLQSQGHVVPYSFTYGTSQECYFLVETGLRQWRSQNLQHICLPLTQTMLQP